MLIDDKTQSTFKRKRPIIVILTIELLSFQFVTGCKRSESEEGRANLIKPECARTNIKEISARGAHSAHFWDASHPLKLED